jgi:hypothetical protein
MDIPMDVALSDLQHYGIKGMRWGQRNAKGGSNTSGVGETTQEFRGYSQRGSGQDQSRRLGD